MKRTCGNCVMLAIRNGKGYTRPGTSTYCWLTGLSICRDTMGCALHVSEEDTAVKQQAQDEKWGPGASVPLAITE